MKKHVLTIAISLLCLAVSAQNFNQYGTSSLLNNYGNVTGGNTAFTALNNLGSTEGTRFLFNAWAKGTVVDAQGNSITGDGLGFNFDKQSGNLIIKKDESSFISVLPSQVKEFTLSSDGKTYHFQRISAIDSSKIMLALVEGSSKYSLYKSIKTRFEKNNYSTNGIAESGHNYDEYVDQDTYYILMPNGTATKAIELKAKSIKSALSADKAKVNDYTSQHSSDEINESFLVGLVNYLNQ